MQLAAACAEHSTRLLIIVPHQSAVSHQLCQARTPQSVQEPKPGLPDAGRYRLSQASSYREGRRKCSNSRPGSTSSRAGCHSLVVVLRVVEYGRLRLARSDKHHQCKVTNTACNFKVGSRVFTDLSDRNVTGGKGGAERRRTSVPGLQSAFTQSGRAAAVLLHTPSGPAARDAAE
jgi:hypothetical protein